MRYDKYQKKINRINKILNLIYRGRFIIIAVVSAAIVTTITLISTKGIVQETEPFSSEFTYGDIISYKAGAFMNDAKTEYAKKDSDEWSENAPKYVGEYKMRCYSFDGWGNKKFGPTHNFTIKPYETTMTFTVSQFKYGETPKATLNLNSGDSLSSYEVIYDNLFGSELKTKAKVDANSVKILNSNGDDISYCYSINAVETELTVLSRAIEVELASENSYYDGKEHYIAGGEITSGTLASGDEIVYGEGITLKDPETDTYLGPISIKHGDKDVTHLYTINKLTKESSIKKIPYSISSLDVNRIYNGKTVSENDDLDFVLDCPLFVPGHRFEFSHNTEIDDLYIQTESIDIDYDFHIYDGDEDVTDKYYVLENKSIGSLTINKQPLSIESTSSSKVYDGLEFSASSFNQTGLVEGDVLTIDTSLLLPGNVIGSFDNVQTYSLTREIDGVTIDVSDCYDISVSYGLLNIEKRHIDIAMPSYGTIKYDGQVHTLNNFILLNEDEDLDKFNFSLLNDPISFIDSGIYNCDDNEIVVRLNDVDVTDCFDINYIYSDTIVEQREITANLKSFSTSAVIYDGKNHTVGTIEIGGDGLAQSDHVTNIQKVYKNVGTYYCSPEDVQFDIVDESGRSVLDTNYIYEWSCETIQIDPKQISVSLPNSDTGLIYDGQGHQFSLDKTQFIGDNALCEGDDISLSPDPYSVVDAGTYNIKDEEDFNIVVTNEGTDITENYDIHFVEGTGIVNIQKRQTTITYPSYKEVYDGQGHYLGNPVASNLATNDVVKFVPKEIKDVKKYGKNDIATDSFDTLGNPIIINSITGEDVSKNYEITCVFEESEVTAKEISVSLDSYNAVYDGNSHDVNTFTYLDGKTPINGHTVTISNFISITDYGEYTNMDPDLSKRAKVNIVDENGVHVESNYAITLSEKAKSSISTLQIPVTVEGFSKEYSGLRYFDEGGKQPIDCLSYDETLLPDGWEISCEQLSNPYFGSGNMQSVVRPFTVNDSLTPEVKDLDINLQLTYKPYSIVKKELPLTCVASSKTYDGTTNVANIEQCHLKAVYPETFDTSINNLKYNYQNTIQLSDSLVGTYAPIFIYDDLSIINLGIDELFGQDTKQYFNIDFTQCADKYNIYKRRLSLENVEVKEIANGLPQSEEILQSGLINGEKLYFEFKYTDTSGTHNVKERIEAGKKLYDCVVDNIDPGIYQYTLINGADIIGPKFFSVYRTKNGVDEKINGSYNISFTSNVIIISSAN